jgi:hypothetical protein
MSTDAPAGQTSPPSSRQALADAFQAAVRAESERKAAEALERARGPRRPWAAIASLVVLVGVGLWLAVDRPKWLFPPPVPESAKTQDAGLRLTMYAAAVRIKSYQVQYQELPGSLKQVEGVSTRDLQYERVGDGGWVLRGRRGAITLTLRSDEPIEAFLGTSLSAFTVRGGR